MSLYESLLGLISEQISQTDGTNFYESHRLIYDAICSGSAETAALRMLEHFSNKFPNYQYYKQIL